MTEGAHIWADLLTCLGLSFAAAATVQVLAEAITRRRNRPLHDGNHQPPDGDHT